MPAQVNPTAPFSDGLDSLIRPAEGEAQNSSRRTTERIGRHIDIPYARRAISIAESVIEEEDRSKNCCVQKMISDATH
ncbi:MAG: hypothetical protein AAFX92_01070 [Pseudomonadota bacterium]